MMEGISRRELARREGIAESSVRRHIESGALAAAVLPDGSLDAEKASAALAAVVTNAKRVPVALTHARGRRLRVQVRAREDEVADLQVSAVPPEVAATLLREQAAIITRHARPLAEAAAKLAGLTAAAALPKRRPAAPTEAVEECRLRIRRARPAARQDVTRTNHPGAELRLEDALEILDAVVGIEIGGGELLQLDDHVHRLVLGERILEDTQRPEAVGEVVAQ